MKISDIYEASTFDDNLERNIQDVVMLFKANDIGSTNIENLINELNKRDLTTNIEDVTTIITKLGYKVDNNNNVVINPDNIDKSTDVGIDDNIEGNNKTEFNPALQKAKSALNKRM